MSAPITAFVIPDAYWEVDRGRDHPEPWCWDLNIPQLEGRWSHSWVWQYTSSNALPEDQAKIGKYVFCINVNDWSYSDKEFGDAGVFDTFEQAAKVCELAYVTYKLTGELMLAGDMHGS